MEQSGPDSAFSRMAPRPINPGVMAEQQEGEARTPESPRLRYILLLVVAAAGLI